jgi:hypothetical protein
MDLQAKEAACFKALSNGDPESGWMLKSGLSSEPRQIIALFD